MGFEMWMGFPILMVSALALIASMVRATVKNERRNSKRSKSGGM